MQSGTKIGIPAWRDSPDVCAFSDGERHLGHIIRDFDWIAFDATHPSETGDGIRQLGTFSSVVSAKEAVERAVAVHTLTEEASGKRAGTSIQ